MPPGDRIPRSLHRTPQPVCRGCWNTQFGGGNVFAVRTRKVSTCCLCGNATTSGIWIPLDPTQVPHPHVKEPK